MATTKSDNTGKKVVANKKLWTFWYYNLVDYEYETIFYKGPFEKLRCDGSDYYFFLNHILLPGIEKGYVSMEDEDENKLTEIPTKLKQSVVVYFKPENLIKKMHRYLAKDILEDHYLALEECGWNVEGLTPAI